VVSTYAAQAQYRALTTAMHQTDPACDGDDRFTADPWDLTEHERARLAATCRACPLFDLCHQYASKARPAGGMWAGRYYAEGTKR